MPSASKTAQIVLALALPSSVLLLYWWYRKSLSDEDGYGERRVVTSRSSVIEVAVPYKAVGAVIGKQGSSIKNIQKQTGARLHFKDRDGGESGDSRTHRTVVIHGSTEAAQQAELMVHQIIAEMPEVIEEEIEVPQYSVGRLIGKGGKSIQELCLASGAQINVKRQDVGKSPDELRVVTLRGSRKQIDAALGLIEEKLEEEEKFRAKMFVGVANRNQRTGKGGARQNGSGLHDQKSTEETGVKRPLVPVAREDDASWEGVPADSLSRKSSLPVADIFLEVFVSAVEHPGHFWVQMVGPKGVLLEQLQKEITDFAMSPEARKNYRLTSVEPGQLVAARFDPEDPIFYRAEILCQLEGGNLDLYFVDFGDNGCVPKDEVFLLRSDFTSFPYQAIECQLDNVESTDKGGWRDEEITCFEDLVHCAQWKVLFARVVSHCPATEGVLRPVVQLVDTSGDKDVNIGDEMVRLGLAKHSRGAAS